MTKIEAAVEKQIAYRVGGNRWLYVGQLPGDGGKDWGYVGEAAQALPLSPYWQRRFAATMRALGGEAHFRSCPGQEAAGATSAPRQGR